MPSSHTQYTLAEINKMPLLPYARTMAVVFANASWVPVLAFANRPFQSLDHLHSCMVAVLKNSDENSKLQVIEQQPDLINLPDYEDEPAEFQLFLCDQTFQASLTSEEKQTMETLQKKYQEQFGFPLVFSPFGQETKVLIESLTTRLANGRDHELSSAIEAASQLAYARLQELIRPG